MRPEHHAGEPVRLRREHRPPSTVDKRTRTGKRVECAARDLGRAIRASRCTPRSSGCHEVGIGSPRVRGRVVRPADSPCYAARGSPGTIRLGLRSAAIAQWGENSVPTWVPWCRRVTPSRRDPRRGAPRARARSERSRRVGARGVYRSVWQTPSDSARAPRGIRRGEVQVLDQSGDRTLQPEARIASGEPTRPRLRRRKGGAPSTTRSRKGAFERAQRGFAIIHLPSWRGETARGACLVRHMKGGVLVEWRASSGHTENGRERGSPAANSGAARRDSRAAWSVSARGSSSDSVAPSAGGGPVSDGSRVETRGRLVGAAKHPQQRLSSSPHLSRDLGAPEAERRVLCSDAVGGPRTTREKPRTARASCAAVWAGAQRSDRDHHVASNTRRECATLTGSPRGGYL